MQKQLSSDADILLKKKPVQRKKAVKIYLQREFRNDDT